MPNNIYLIILIFLPAVFFGIWNMVSRSRFYAYRKMHYPEEYKKILGLDSTKWI